MAKKERLGVLNRRNFLRSSSLLAASAVIVPMGAHNLFNMRAASAKENAIPSIKNVTLNNGLIMPMLGFGTFMLRDDTCKQCVADAISTGYRLIDTATVYNNEEAVGAGIKQSGIKREELFITSKVWPGKMGYEDAKKEFEKSLNRLGLEYLDLYLIHRPRNDYNGTWKAMEELYHAGKIRAIGVSNFESEQLEDLIKNNKVKPAVNQIETHAFFQQSQSYDVLEKNNIQMEGWAPFAEGRNGLFSNEILAEIGKKYNKTNAQVSLRWYFQRGIVAIPRTSQKAHMIENLDIFNFELSKKDMKTIAALDLNVTQFPEW